MKEEEVKIGMLVRIVDIKPHGFSVVKKHLCARRMGDTGTVIEMIPGHGGEAFGVQHDDGSIAVYSHDEFEEEGTSRKEKLERMWSGSDTPNISAGLELVWIRLGLTGSPEHPTIGELVEALGYETIYDALVAIVKEKGLWKEEWDRK